MQSAIAQPNYARLVNETIQKFARLPVIYPLLRVLFSRKGLASIAYILYSVLSNDSISQALLFDQIFFLVILYVVSTALEDVSKAHAAPKVVR